MNNSKKLQINRDFYHQNSPAGGNSEELRIMHNMGTELI